MTISIREAYDRGDEVLGGHHEDEDRGKDAAQAYVEDILGIPGPEWVEGASAEIAGATASLRSGGIDYLPPVLFSSFVAGVEWQRERDGS